MAQATVENVAASVQSMTQHYVFGADGSVFPVQNTFWSDGAIEILLSNGQRFKVTIEELP